MEHTTIAQKSIRVTLFSGILPYKASALNIPKIVIACIREIEFTVQIYRLSLVRNSTIRSDHSSCRSIALGNTILHPTLATGEDKRHIVNLCITVEGIHTDTAGIYLVPNICLNPLFSIHLKDHCLSVCDQIVQMLRGHIEVRNRIRVDRFLRRVIQIAEGNEEFFQEHIIACPNIGIIGVDTSCQRNPCIVGQSCNLQPRRVIHIGFKDVEPGVRFAAQTVFACIDLVIITLDRPIILPAILQPVGGVFTSNLAVKIILILTGVQIRVGRNDQFIRHKCMLNTTNH